MELFLPDERKTTTTNEQMNKENMTLSWSLPCKTGNLISVIYTEQYIKREYGEFTGFDLWNLP